MDNPSFAEMMIVTVVNIRRSPCDLYCGRTCFGRINVGLGNPFFDFDRPTNIRRFRELFHSPTTTGEQLRAIARQHAKPGLVLGCWCAPEECHADVIAEYMNTHLFPVNKEPL